MGTLEMMKQSLCALAIVLAIGAGQAQSAETLKLDNKQSKIEFVGKKADGKHAGGFKSFESTAVADLTDPSASKRELVIDTTSIWSDNEKLTNHLKNPDFFDVRKHPKVTFTATKITPTGEGKADITGNLTMLGKTTPITVPAEVKTDDQSVTLNATFKLDRTKWGMDYGAGNIENDVDVKATLVYLR
jgi:polyisoprenoid-binding protein YceI